MRATKKQNRLMESRPDFFAYQNEMNKSAANCGEKLFGKAAKEVGLYLVWRDESRQSTRYERRYYEAIQSQRYFFAGHCLANIMNKYNA